MARGMDIDLQLISHQVQGVGVIGTWLLAQQQDEQNKRHIENLMSTLTQVARRRVGKDERAFERLCFPQDELSILLHHDFIEPEEMCGPVTGC